MSHRMVRFDRFAGKAVFMFLTLLSVFTFITACAQPAHGCLTCAQRDDGTWYCQVVTQTAGDVCVITAHNCTLYYNCICYTHCGSCPPTGCPANWKGPIDSGPRVTSCTLKQAAMRGTPALIRVGDKTMTDEEKLADFINHVEAGDFSGKKEGEVTVYMMTSSSIAHALMNTVPTSRWKAFYVGFETDTKTGKQSKAFRIETKNGKKVKIVLVDDPAK